MLILTVVNSLLAEGLSLIEACYEADLMLGVPPGTTKKAIRLLVAHV